MKLLVATRSLRKMSEIRQILSEVPGLTLVSLDDVGVAATPAEDDIEAFDTFEENALAKAVYFHARTGLPSAADDSGLEVDALRGAPGVRSKRFAPVQEGTSGEARDQANNDHLLELLSNVPEAERQSRYVCAVALVDKDGTSLTMRGQCEGKIGSSPRGTGGFGYDPLFQPDGLGGRTFGEATPEEKNARSHRGSAFRELARLLAAYPAP